MPEKTDYAHRAAHLGSRPFRSYKWNNTHDEGKGGHENRAEPKTRCLDRSG
jgi:hypothetical protein